MGNTQTLERTLTVGPNTPVMFTWGDDQYTGWELNLKAPDNHKAQIGPPDSRGWSLEKDEGRNIATVGCGIREHAKVIWLNSPDGEYPFHTRIEGVITGCKTAGGGGRGGKGGKPPPFSIEIIDGLVFLIEEESNTGVDTPVRIAAYRRQGSEYSSGEGEDDLIPVEVDWSCDDNDLVFLESVSENGEHSPGEPLASDDMRQTSVWVKSSQEDSYTVTANFEGTDSGSGNLPAQQLTAYVNVYDLALVVDANRDLKINHLDRKDDNGNDVITSDNPWRFWYNDDNDFEGPDASSEFNAPTYSKEQSDFNRYQKTGGDVKPAIRDFTDMYPLYMYVKSHYLKTKKKNGDMVFGYRLSISELNASFSDLDTFSIFTKLEAGESGMYLSDVETAEEISKTIINDAYRSRANGSIAFGQGTRSISIVGEFLENMLKGNGGVLLRQHFGYGIFTGKFELSVTDSDGNQLFSKELPFSFSNVEGMFSHIDLTGYVNNDPTYVNQSRYLETAPVNYPDELTNDTRFVYVHGYNNNMTASRGSNSEIYKRLHLVGSKAKYIAVSWYGWQSQSKWMNPSNVGYKCAEYQLNVINAFRTAYLFSNALKTPKISKKRTVIAAHSLGNMVVSAAIQDFNPRDSDGNPTGKIANRYLMINAAVSQEAYANIDLKTVDKNMIPFDWNRFLQESMDNHINPEFRHLFAWYWFTYFPDGDSRQRLTWRGRFGEVLSLSKVTNLWSVGDRTFYTHPHTSSSFSQPIEAFNTGLQAFSRQEKRKGGGGLWNDIVGGWGVNYYYEIIFNPDSNLVTTGGAPMEQCQHPERIPEDQIIQYPYFRGRNPGLRSEKHSEINVERYKNLFIPENTEAASRYDFRNTLLAVMIPSRFNGMGRAENDEYLPQALDNLEMQKVFSNNRKWPKEHHEPNRYWDHGSFHTIGLPYTYNLYNYIFKELK